MKKLWLIFLALFALTGCIPAAFVVGAAAGGAIIYDNRSTQTMVEDRNITFQAQNALDYDQELHNRAHLSVATFNHIVLLVGQVPTKELRDHAESIIKPIPNIKMLYNQATVENPSTTMDRTNDAWITTKVKSTLLSLPGLKSTQIKVVTEKGVVYLMGLTSRQQAKLASDNVRIITGVTKVVKLFEYLN